MEMVNRQEVEKASMQGLEEVDLKGNQVERMKQMETVKHIGQKEDHFGQISYVSIVVKRDTRGIFVEKEKWMRSSRKNRTPRDGF